MYKLKKFLPVLLIAALLVFCATPAYAQARYGLMTSRPIEADGILVDQDGNNMDSATWVYGVTIYADSAANAFIGLYNHDDAADLALTTSYSRYEIGEPTQYESTTELFDKPFYFDTGVVAVISVGVAWVYYGAEPN